ncbi:MAG TPA: carbon-nitrogen hydrolase family protein [Steroidobacteraceae bacterium]|nr:carbon-nitrogen hydrolase family protein [Steroidobacteraceae bacterium]
MRVTVTQMHDAPADFARDWVRLAEHVRLERSEVVLLPEMPFHPWFATHRTFDPKRWQAALADHDAWEKRLGELGARHVLGTRPVDFGNERYNSAFSWDAASGVRMVHTKAYLPDEEGVWEASWYNREAPDFVPFPIAGAEAGFLICTELWALEQARCYAQENVSLLFTPRLTSAATRDKWLAGGRTAAVVSGAWGLSSNRYDDSGRFGGQGWVVSPDGEVLGLTSAEVPFITADVDIEAAVRVKSTYPRYALDAPQLP